MLSVTFTKISKKIIFSNEARFINQNKNSVYMTFYKKTLMVFFAIFIICNDSNIVIAMEPENNRSELIELIIYPDTIIPVKDAESPGKALEGCLQAFLKIGSNAKITLYPNCEQEENNPEISLFNVKQLTWNNKRSKKYLKIILSTKKKELYELVNFPMQFQQRILYFLTQDMSDQKLCCHDFFITTLYGYKYSPAGTKKINLSIKSSPELRTKNEFFALPLDVKILELIDSLCLKAGDGIVFFTGDKTNGLQIVHFGFCLGLFEGQVIVLEKCANGESLMVQTLKQSIKSYKASVVGYISYKN